MKKITADIWSLVETHLIVIPTNVGWNSHGENIMGRGLARQASLRYPELALWYGTECKKFGSKTPVMRYPEGPILLMPVKPLNSKQPWFSWKSRADLELITKGTHELAQWPGDDPIAVPLVGCGAGGLDTSEVLPVLNDILKDDRYTLIWPKEEYE